MTKVLLIARNTIQIISALVLKETEYKNCKVDLLLADNIKIFHVIADSDKFVEIFNQIILMKEDSKIREDFNKIHRIIEYTKFRLSKSKMNKQFYKDIAYDYDIVCYYNYSDYLGIYLNKLKKKNRNIQFVRYDEGLESYFIEVNMKKSFKEKCAEKIYGMYSESPLETDLYLMEPELYCGVPYRNVKKLEISENVREKLIDMFMPVIDLKDDNAIQGVLIFEESLDHINDKKSYVEMLQLVLDKYGKEHVKVKSHPRNTEAIIEADRLELDVPWEIYCLIYRNKLNNLKLFSIASTACYTPFFLGCEQIQSYLLYPIISGAMTVTKFKKFDEFMRKLTDRYKGVNIVYNKKDL